MTVDDFRIQLQQIIKQGLLTKQALRRYLGIMDSMTNEERNSPDIIDSYRRKRIAVGSGVEVAYVDAFMRDFFGVREMMRRMST